MIQERQYIKDSLYDVIAALIAETGFTVPVVYEHGKGVRPKAPFISLEFLGGETPGLPNYTKTDENGVQQVIQYVRKTMTMSAFGEGAIDLLETIKARLFFQSWRDALARVGLVIPQAHNVLEHPRVLDTSVENGASFDFDIDYMRVMEQDAGFIEQAELREHFVHQDGNA